jgi:hypothetical protein
VVVNFICVSGCDLFIALILFLNGTRENESKSVDVFVCVYVCTCVCVGREGLWAVCSDRNSGLLKPVDYFCYYFWRLPCHDFSLSLSLSFD